MSKRLVIVCGLLLVGVACVTSSERVSGTSSAVTTCWDPGFGIDQCDQGEWWVEYSVSDTSTTSMRLEVQGTTRVVDLTYVDALGDGSVKFTNGPSDGPITTGSMVHLVASNGSQTATSAWFPYLQATPSVDCSSSVDAGATEVGTTDSGTTPDSNTPDVWTMEAGNDVVDSGGNDSGCAPSWSPYWSQTPDAGEWWTEYYVQGGGSLPVSVGIEVNGTTYPLAYCCGKWTGGPGYIPTGTTVVLHATDATGATAQTTPFPYLTQTAPSTDACKTTPSTTQSCVPLTRGMLSITMDDSYPSQNTLAAPLMSKYGVTATIYNITRQLDLYGDLPNALALANAGHEVGSHTVTHPDLTTLSVTDVDTELANSQSYLVSNLGSVDSFATPMGSYNATVLTEIRKYYQSHRTVNPGLNYMGSSVYELNSDGAYNTVSPSQICSMLQDTATYRGWRILMFHDFTTDPTSNADLLYPIADFESVLQCATTTPGLDVVTVHDGANAIRCASN
jgi:peptidoglycan/xylan/chitin deacetylase (PgdA/CDA1 family)